MSQYKVLILEDDECLCSVVKDYLCMFNYHVDVCHNAVCFAQSIQHLNYDLVMLDLNLPDADGLDVLQQLRESNQILVYVISGRTDQQSRIKAFELGADDFITKPFSIKELELKVRNALLRSGLSSNQTDDTSVNDALTLTIFDLCLDKNTRTMKRNGYDPIDLTRGEFELLGTLIQAYGAIVTRKDLLQHLSKTCNINSQESITTLVYRLRKKFMLIDLECPIVTMAGEGYRLERRKVGN